MAINKYSFNAFKNKTKLNIRYSNKKKGQFVKWSWQNTKTSQALPNSTTDELKVIQCSPRSQAKCWRRDNLFGIHQGNDDHLDEKYRQDSRALWCDDDQELQV